MKEAVYKIETEHHSEKYIIDADDFAGLTFKAQKRNLQVDKGIKLYPHIDSMLVSLWGYVVF